MKNLIFTLVLIIAVFNVKASEKEITATVTFENLTNNIMENGVFTISEIDKQIVLNTTKTFSITLPKKGKYRFSFSSQKFIAYTLYPSRISKKKNHITIRLVNKNKSIFETFKTYKVTHINNKWTDLDIENLIKTGQANFIINAIDHSIPKTYNVFKNLYNIGFIKDNCSINPLSFNLAMQNNKRLSQYLIKKYGKNWLLDLPIQPLGIKK